MSDGIMEAIREAQRDAEDARSIEDYRARIRAQNLMSKEERAARIAAWEENERLQQEKEKKTAVRLSRQRTPKPSQQEMLASIRIVPPEVAPPEIVLPADEKSQVGKMYQMLSSLLSDKENSIPHEIEESHLIFDLNDEDTFSARQMHQALSSLLSSPPPSPGGRYSCGRDIKVFEDIATKGRSVKEVSKEIGMSSGCTRMILKKMCRILSYPESNPMNGRGVKDFEEHRGFWTRRLEIYKAKLRKDEELKARVKLQKPSVEQIAPVEEKKVIRQKNRSPTPEERAEEERKNLMSAFASIPKRNESMLSFMVGSLRKGYSDYPVDS